jgi:hypothetical protein
MSTIHRYCDGMKRRDFVRAGMLGAAGLSLSNYLQLAAAGEVDPKAKTKSAIFVYLGGGPTHLDTFDLKPDAPAEFRGDFKPIKTKSDGVEFCELLPKLAQVTPHFALLRGVSHTLAAHEFGTKYMSTGNRPIPSLEYPGFGSVIAKELKGYPELPPYVAVPNTPERAGFLGIAMSAFNTTAAPRPNQPFNVRGLAPVGGQTPLDVDRRNKLLERLDTKFKSADAKSDLIHGLDRFSDQAVDILSSRKAREAFDIAKESPSLAKSFGDDPFGQSCLLATRLVESGVRFVTVNHGGWDTHQNNTDAMKRKLPVLDAGLAGLFAALASKGLLESTTVYVTGEFGRTPKINPRAGRDHYPRAMFCLLGGGGIKGGQVVGASDKTGAGPKDKPITPEMVAATFYKAMGIDHHKEYNTNTGRPVMIVRDGEPVKELLG